jgi:hypothetical protein
MAGLREDLKALDIQSDITQWRVIQEYWRNAITQATFTAIAMGSTPLRAYILHISAKKFNVSTNNNSLIWQN